MEGPERGRLRLEDCYDTFYTEADAEHFNQLGKSTTWTI